MNCEFDYKIGLKYPCTSAHAAVHGNFVYLDAWLTVVTTVIHPLRLDNMLPTAPLVGGRPSNAPGW